MKPQKQEIEVGKVAGFSVIGDPGCDGLGAATMSIFARALTCIDSDISLVLGDIVPLGIRRLYENTVAFIDAVAQNPVYSLCGNHDTEYYEEFFGLKNYLLRGEELLLVFLDNSRRRFESETLDFLAKALSGHRSKNIVLLFHIPPPNSICGNSVSSEEWEKLRRIIEPHKAAIRYLLCGHVHSYFEDVVDGIPLVVSGGGGARIEHVNESIDLRKAHHHILFFRLDEERNLSFDHILLDNRKYEQELGDAKLAGYLETSFANEAAAHIKYALLAEDAEEKGLKGIAALFRAFADSEMYHARNYFMSLNRLDTVRANLQASLESERYEVDTMYRKYLEYCDAGGLGFSRYSFFDSREAEKVHASLLQEAMKAEAAGRDIPELDYYTCTSCGYTFGGGQKPRNCPVCGAPSDKIRAVS
jgi:rubrerythrin